VVQINIAVAKCWRRQHLTRLDGAGVPRSKSSSNWIKEHEDDKFVKLARKNGFRSRASYKLMEIQEQHRIIQSGMRIVDLGAAPGGWSQVVIKEVGPNGLVYALDLLPIEPIDGVTRLQGDFTEDEVLQRLLDELHHQRIDLVISDMAPNLSGMKEVDQPGMVYLMELALEFARSVLNPGGSLLVKGFQGEGIDTFRQLMKSTFKTLKTCKPAASRARSSEFYLLGRGMK
jgi:23S rRNA (uridine2552-2'-O)-methyltransferase